MPVIKAGPMISGIPHEPDEPQIFNGKGSPDDIGNYCIGGFMLTQRIFIFKSFARTIVLKERPTP